jgi:hypothetical protein
MQIPPSDTAIEKVPSPPGTSYPPMCNSVGHLTRRNTKVELAAGIVFRRTDSKAVIPAHSQNKFFFQSGHSPDFVDASQ